MFHVVKPDGYAALIEDTFLRSVVEGQNWPWCLVGFHQLRADFQRRTRRPETRMGVAVLRSTGAPLGWAAVVPHENEVIYAYTLGPFRTKERFEPRVATTLITELGVDLTKPTTLRYWTPAAETLSKRAGYFLEPAR